MSYDLGLWNLGRSVAEYFAGIGLMRLGLEQAGWKVVWANDIDPTKQAMYLGHFGYREEEFALGDVHALDADAIPSTALATASFPCNDLSLAGARRGLAGTQSGAFWGFADALEAMNGRRPALVLLENVAGFLSSHDGNDFRDVCLRLNALGYDVDAFLIDAIHFVPQSRARLFIVGSPHAAARARIMEESPSFFQGPGRPPSLADFIAWHPEIRWAVRSLPLLPKRSLSLADILEPLSPNSAFWWSQARVDYLLGQMSDRHRRIANQMIKDSKISYGTIFRRVRHGRSMAELRTDGIAGCLRTPRGGSGRQILLEAGRGNAAARLLTPLECARLMGADEFRIGSDISLNQALFGFGDAVCVPVIRWIAENYLNPLFAELSGDEESLLKRRVVRYGRA
ncbi:MAG: DNA (cytosine-5-)-methyltransferase [Terrimicrobiaceae bacterium]